MFPGLELGETRLTFSVVVGWASTGTKLLVMDVRDDE
jgi:hypothetical protein